MFPIIWRFLLSQYIKVMLFCIVAFVAVLLTMRLGDIAHFAALDATVGIIVLFVLHQIPYILPIAIPISCLISAILLAQKLSKTHELTALRACGMAIKDFIAPLLIAGAFLALANFYIVSELATHSHLSTGFWKSELRSVNPLLLLRNKHLMKMHGAYYDALGTSRLGESSSEVVMAVPNSSSQRINLLLAKRLQANADTLKGESVTLITSLEAASPDGFDHLLIENMMDTELSSRDFSQMIQRKVWQVNNDHLQMPLLFARLREEKKLLAEAEARAALQTEIKAISRGIDRSYSEILRRVSVAVAAFTFTLLGASFGITVGRQESYRSLYFVMGITALYLTAYFAAKSIEHLFIASTLLYTLPHVVIIGCAVWNLKRISRGVE